MAADTFSVTPQGQRILADPDNQPDLCHFNLSTMSREEFAKADYERECGPFDSTTRLTTEERIELLNRRPNWDNDWAGLAGYDEVE